MKRLLASSLAVSLFISSSGCGTLIHGTRQDMPVSVTPPGAEVTVYRWSGEVVGGPLPSPGELSAERPKRYQPYLVRASKPGYCPKYWLTTSSTTGGSWTYLWMAFVPALGPILIALTAGLIDQSTGGCCAIEPESFQATLTEEDLCAP